MSGSPLNVADTPMVPDFYSLKTSMREETSVVLSPVNGSSGRNSVASPTTTQLQNAMKERNAISPMSRTVSRKESNALMRIRSSAPAHPAVNDMSEFPDQVVSREAYIKLQGRLTDERVSFLKETSALRQYIFRLESNAAASKEMEVSRRVIAAASPTRKSPTSRYPAASPVISPSLSPAEKEVSTATNKTTGGKVINPPPVSLQLVPLKEIHTALNDVDVLETERELHQNELDKTAEVHAMATKKLNDKIRELESELSVIRERHRRDMDNHHARMDVEREKFRAEASADTKAIVDELKATVEKLASNLESAKEQNEALKTKIESLTEEDSRKSHVIAQLQQQVAVLSDERAEMKSALMAVSADQQKREKRLMLAQEENQTLRDNNDKLEARLSRYADSPTFGYSHRDREVSGDRLVTPSSATAAAAGGSKRRSFLNPTPPDSRSNTASGMPPDSASLGAGNRRPTQRRSLLVSHR